MAHLPFRWHLVELVVVLGVASWHVAVADNRVARRRLIAAYATLMLVTVWPLGDLAARVSLTVATTQRLVLMLLVAPLLLMGTPTALLARLTKPAVIDEISRRLFHPAIAVVFVTVVGTATLSTPIVDWGARSEWGRGLTVLLVLFCGLVLWAPVVGLVPGVRRLSPAARAGYVFASALVVTSLSFVWIFSLHSLYPGLHDQRTLVHMSPLLDQQVAGFVAKLGCYLPMWVVAYVIFFRADEQGQPVEESPLHWADVERQLERVDRQRARALRRHRPE
jgi:cytochrome c oxidase assembly factor CtaG